jgi:hypothetical protein
MYGTNADDLADVGAQPPGHQWGDASFTKFVLVTAQQKAPAFRPGLGY